MKAIATFVPRPGPTRRSAAVALVALCVVISAAAPARAETWPPLVVLPASGRAVSAAIIRRARALLVDSLGRRGRFRVVDYDRPPTPLGPGTNVATGLAQLTGARVAVWMDLSRDTGRTVFEIWCWDAQLQRPACHLRETTAAGPESLPDFTEWLALKLLRTLDESPSEAGPGAPTLTGAGGMVAGIAAGAATPPRRPRVFTFGVRAGVTTPVDSPARDISPLGRFGVLMSADLGYLLADVGLDYQAGAESRRLWGVGLDLMVPMGSGERLPYIGGGAWLVDQRLGGRGASGLQLRPTLGMLWGRHDVARLRLDAAYFVDVFEERELDRLFPGSGQAHVAHGLMISTGATF
jgi:hypothetical protein